MYLSKFQIVNFKKFKDVTINFHNRLNILTGYNNSGKTTILEALALWNEIYTKLIHKVNSQDRKLGLKKGQYRLGFASSTHHSYFEYSDIVSIRTTGYDDIFYNLDENYILLIASFKNDSDSLEIGFKIEKANGMNYKIFLYDWREFDYEYFNNFFDRPLNPINTIFVSPIANILSQEIFQTNPVIKDKIIKRQSNEVLRNRIYNLDETQFSIFKQKIEYILFNNKFDISLKEIGDKKSDIYISYQIELGSNDIFKNIALLGSGSIQMIELLLSIVEASNELNIILLDEPDSHIHRDIQKRLLEVLNSFDYIQVFLTTHNESLIRSAKPEYIFHLEDVSQKEYFSILNDKIDGIRFGLQPTKQLKVLQSLGSETSLDLLNALETDYLILVEGKSDPLYIQEILDKKYSDKRFHIMYWSFDGIDNIFKHILSYKTLFSSIKNEVSLWDKAILVLDRDFLTPTQAKNMTSDLTSKLKIPVFMWDFYTIESVLLSDINKFALLIQRFLKNYNIEVQKDNIIEIIQKSINDIVKTKLQDIENKKLVEPFTIRRKAIVENNFNKNILPESTGYSDIKDYHISKLHNNQIDSLTTKDDVIKIIVDCAKAFNIELKETDIFYELIKIADNTTTWYDEWDRLVKVIEERKTNAE